MTATPEPTDNDWEWLRFYQSQFRENPDIPFDNKCHPESRMWFRLLSHYQRENEKLGETVKKAREERQRIENIARSRKMTDLEKILPLVHGVMNLKDILGVEVTDAAKG